MRHHLFYKLDYGFKWNTQGNIYKHQGKLSTASLFHLEKGKIPKSNWFWLLRRKVVELIHGNIWLDKILSKNAIW